MSNDMNQYSFFSFKDNIKVFNLEFQDKGIILLAENVIKGKELHL